MFGELCNQDVLRLLGADDVVVELLVDVGRGLSTCEIHGFILGWIIPAVDFRLFGLVAQEGQIIVMIFSVRQ